MRREGKSKTTRRDKTLAPARALARWRELRAAAAATAAATGTLATPGRIGGIALHRVSVAAGAFIVHAIDAF